MQSISSYGFSSLEQRVLEKQIDIVSTKIHAGWTYVGEGNRARIVLAKEEIDVDESSVLVLVGNDVKSSKHMALELPIRLVQLAELLSQSHQDSNSDESKAIAISKLISENEASNFSLACPDFLVYFMPLPRLIGVRDKNFQELIENLVRSEVDLTKVDFIEDAAVADDLATLVDAKKVVWHVAKSERTFSDKARNDNSQFKLAAWPRVKEWDASPLQSKLAALFARQFTLPSQAAEVLKTDIITVKAFLHCCESVDIPILEQASVKEELQVRKIPVSEEKNDATSLGWLQKKLKSFLNYGN